MISTTFGRVVAPGRESGGWGRVVTTGRCNLLAIF